MGWRATVQSILRRRGYELVRYPLLDFIRRNNINVVLDVGANCGQFALELRELGYEGTIVSFEPLSSAYETLSRQSDHDPRWTAVNVALGRDKDRVRINIAANSTSSSIREILSRHTRPAPDAAYTGFEEVDVLRLSDIYHQYCTEHDRVFLKIDTQGYEREVIEGGVDVLSQFEGIKMEMSLVPLYEGEALAEDLIALMRRNGFEPYWINHGFKDPDTQQLLQVDGIFVRQD